MFSFGVLIITIIFNSAVLISIPMHVLLYRALSQMKKNLNTNFHDLVRHISVLSLMCSIVHILVEVSFQHPPLDAIVPGHPFWENIVGYVIDMESYQLPTAIIFMHVFTALNRFLAIILPEQYRLIMNIRTITIFCYSATIFMIVSRLPTLWPVTWVAYHPVDNTIRQSQTLFLTQVKTSDTMYALDSQPINKLYTAILIFVGFIVFLFIYLCYIIIAIKLFADKVLSHNKSVQRSAKITTMAAAIMVSGTVFTMNLILAQQFFWYILHRNIMPVDWLRCLLGAGNCFNLSIHPWCLMLVFPDVSSMIL